MLNRVARFMRGGAIDHYFQWNGQKPLGKLRWAAGTGHLVYSIRSWCNGYGWIYGAWWCSTRRTASIRWNMWSWYFPAEINHQIYDLSVAEDTTARGLYRCVNEGFAVYMNQVVPRRKNTACMNTWMYTPEELMYCLKQWKNILPSSNHFCLPGKGACTGACQPRWESI